MTSTGTQEPSGGACMSSLAGKRIRELAVELALTDAGIILEELRNQLDGHQQRLRIMNSQIEHLWKLIARLEAIAEAWEYQVRRVADISHFDLQLQKLTARLLGDALPETTTKTGERRHATGEFAKRFDM
jgi:hypothetical protein